MPGSHRPWFERSPENSRWEVSDTNSNAVRGESTVVRLRDPETGQEPILLFLRRSCTHRWSLLPEYDGVGAANEALRDSHSAGSAEGTDGQVVILLRRRQSLLSGLQLLLTASRDFPEFAHILSSRDSRPAFSPADPGTIGDLISSLPLSNSDRCPCEIDSPVARDSLDRQRSVFDRSRR